MRNPRVVVGSDEPIAGPDDWGAVADRLSSLADTAELMGDDAGAARFHEAAAVVRLEAMNMLDS